MPSDRVRNAPPRPVDYEYRAVVVDPCVIKLKSKELRKIYLPENVAI